MSERPDIPIEVLRHCYEGADFDGILREYKENPEQFVEDEIYYKRVISDFIRSHKGKVTTKHLAKFFIDWLVYCVGYGCIDPVKSWLKTVEYTDNYGVVHGVYAFRERDPYDTSWCELYLFAYTDGLLAEDIEFERR